MTETPENNPLIDEVLSYWFGDWDDDAPLVTPDENLKRWWSKSEATDSFIAKQFGALHGAIHRGDHDAWDASPQGALALVIVFWISLAG